MRIDDTTLKDLLLEESYVSEEDLTAAEKAAEETNTPLVEYLLAHDILTKPLLGQAIAESFGIPFADLSAEPPASEQVLKIPEEVAKKFNVVLFKEDEEGITIATDDPKQSGLAEALATIFPGKKVFVLYALTDDINEVFTNYRKPLDTRFSKIIQDQKSIAPEILDQIFSDALSFHASDIHLEPRAEQVVVRFRIDGVLQEAGRIPKEYYENILNRLKVQSRLRIDEHFTTQDGSLHYESKNGAAADMRVSIVPTIEGEKAVLRVLASYVQGFSLADIGLSAANQKILEDAAAKPFGMILVTGPTGSGKSTTLYALLKLLNRPGVNITTIEDPVEYKMAGINQIQVSVRTDLTFAHGLRSIVRQDPDIILVGEIRDQETAEIAVNAALTGHLLLSTFHANDAATAMPRLIDMGIEPFLLASTLEIVAAQRLVRTICTHCRYSETVPVSEVPLPPKLRTELFGKGEITLYRGKGCDSCSGTGYKGRTALFEFIQVTSAVQDLLLTHPSTQEIWELARKQGSQSLFEDGIDKVKNGITTLEELKRVAEVPDA